jgi:N-acetylglutamate synthase-like GNAT family acetyltransferase
MRVVKERDVTAQAGRTGAAAGLTIRNDLRPGDLGYITYLHGSMYAREYGFDCSFEAYVAGPLSQFVLTRGERERIWIVEKGPAIVGCMAIVHAAEDRAQLRWLLLLPEVRGKGLGRRLVTEGIEFCRAHGYRSLFLWTVDILKEAPGLYRAFGFSLVEEKRHRMWGVDLTEQRYELTLSPPRPSSLAGE